MCLRSFLDEEDKDARRIVEDGVSGLVVPLNERAFAEAIVKLLTQESLRLRLASGARQKVVEEYNASICLAKLACEYWSLVGRENRQSRPSESV